MTLAPAKRCAAVETMLGLGLFALLAVTVVLVAVERAERRRLEQRVEALERAHRRPWEWPGG
ncbi:hypothetical protein GCM10009737_21540 [Nocardioides lentus]|uniref:Uncharacterized protein n=1 Tax=Nocardioides lentus TaxID=338077 RepID=A0ABP5ASC2_9ACTN